MKENFFTIKNTKDGKFIFCADSIKILFVKKGESFNEMLKEAKQKQSSYYKKIDESRLLQLTVDMADNCNMRCKYCYASSGNYHNTRTSLLMNYEILLKGFSEIIEKYKDGIERICFHGGEPLINHKVMCQFVDYINAFCQKNNIQPPSYAVVTNGTLINEELAAFFDKNHFVVSISLDGPKDINDRMRIFNENSKISSYDIILENIKILKKYKNITIISEGTLSPFFFYQYKGNIKSYVDSFLDIGIEEFFPCIALGPLFDYSDKEIKNKIKLFYSDFTTFFLNELVKNNSRYIKSIPSTITSLLFNITGEKKTKECTAGANYIFLGVDGEFYKCQHFYSTKEILNLKEIKKSFPVYKKIFPQCKDCMSKNICSTWCKGTAHEFNNDKPIEVNCIMQNAIVETILKWLVSLSDDQINVVIENLSSKGNRGDIC